MILLLVVGTGVGCGSSSVREIPKGDGSSDAPDVSACVEPDPTFAEVQKLFDQSCVSCHSAGADLDLSVGKAYANLVDQQAPAAESCGGVLVTPGAPDTSYLYIKLSSANPCAGVQMPRTDIYSIPLPACLQKLVRDWIGLGARPDRGGSDGGVSVADSGTNSVVGQ